MTTLSLTRSLLAAAMLLPTSGCLALVPESVMNQLGAASYAEATAAYPEIKGTADAAMVRRVGQRIAQASGHDYQWEFKLLDAPGTPNAFCLPGGKIAVYSGILPLTQNEDGLAAVMGHEVAHATLEHGNKRMTQAIGVSAVEVFAAAAAENWTELDASNRALVMEALGAGAQFGLVLPYSRSHESEADEVGLRYLVRAGYDPREAPRLWDRMAATFPNAQPEWMSTHPDSAARAQRLREIMPTIVQQEQGNEIR